MSHLLSLVPQRMKCRMLCNCKRLASLQDKSGPKAAAKKQQVFVDSWLQHSAFKPWLCKKVGSDGKLKPWCKTCDKELNCSKTGLNRHFKSKSHEKNQASTSFTGNVGDICKRVTSNNNDRAKSMEIKICAFLVQHNLPIS